MITKFTQNAQGQRAVDCLDFNNGKSSESCMLFYCERDILTKCVMLDGKQCPNYKGSTKSIERLKNDKHR